MVAEMLITAGSFDWRRPANTVSLPTPDRPDRTINNGLFGAFNEEKLLRFIWVVTLFLFGWYAGLACLQAACDCLRGERRQDDMPAICEDDGLGPSAACHVYYFTVAFTVMDNAFGRGGIR